MIWYMIWYSLGDHRRIDVPSLTETLLRDAWLYYILLKNRLCSQLTNQYGEKKTGETRNNIRTDIHRIHAIMFITEVSGARGLHICNKRFKNSLIHLKYVALTFYVSLKTFRIHFISVHWLTKFCNISIYPSSVMHLPEDSHRCGRNMQ
jgi:hypothetical protein